jgi:hypothetical protein
VRTIGPPTERTSAGDIRPLEAKNLESAFSRPRAEDRSSPPNIQPQPTGKTNDGRQHNHDGTNNYFDVAIHEA